MEHLILEKPLPYQGLPDGSGFFRTGRITLSSEINLELVFYHNPATASFIYLQDEVQQPPRI